MGLLTSGVEESAEGIFPCGIYREAYFSEVQRRKRYDCFGQGKYYSQRGCKLHFSEERVKRRGGKWGGGKSPGKTRTAGRRLGFCATRGLFPLECKALVESAVRLSLTPSSDKYALLVHPRTRGRYQKEIKGSPRSRVRWRQRK